jgi:hypothetical protein
MRSPCPGVTPSLPGPHSPTNDEQRIRDQTDKAGFGEDIIVTSINRSPGNYDTSVDGADCSEDGGG